MGTAAWIVGALAFFTALGGTLLSPLCTPCIALCLGLGAGYLAPVFEKPPEQQRAVKRGSGAGALAGIGALLGQIAGSIANAIIVGPQGAANLSRSLGLPTGAGFESGYWIGLVITTLCISVINIAIMTGLGALGGLLWWQMSGKGLAVGNAPLQGQ